MTPSITADLQARRDRVLRAEIDSDSSVIRAVDQIDKLTSGHGLRIRRQLLTGALRLTRTVAPHAHRALSACREVLGWDEPVELYVKPDAMAHAFCTRSVAGPIIVGVSS